MNENLMLEALAAKGPEFLVGMDTQRLWATGMQAFISGGVAMVVFREQTMLSDTDTGKVLPAVKNVASVVLPVEVIREFHSNLTTLIEQLQAVENGQQP